MENQNLLEKRGEAHVGWIQESPCGEKDTGLQHCAEWKPKLISRKCEKSLGIHCFEEFEEGSSLRCVIECEVLWGNVGRSKVEISEFERRDELYGSNGSTFQVAK